MIARSTSRAADTMPQRVIAPVIYYVVEVERGNLSDIFDGYIQYTATSVMDAVPVSPANRLLCFTPLKGAAAANRTTVLSYVFTETLILREAFFKTSSALFGDKFTVASYSGGVLVSSMVVDWYVTTDLVRLVFPPKLFIPAGLEMRLSYVNTSLLASADVFMGFVCLRP